ncbi:vesicular transport factor [Salix suchowensis]|nr:vesicular transport factor [Salix suchowensis]
MDPRYTGEILKHLEKQNELLKTSYNSMSDELHKLQVEEEMLMRKFYDLMAAQGLSKKKEGSSNVSDGGERGQSTASLADISDGGIDRHSSAIVPFTTTDEQQ